jgi:hypothetical protein
MARQNDYWKQFEKCMTEMCEAGASRRFAPLLEADVAGYMYFLYASCTGGDASRLHVDTRLYRAPENDKFDFVVGRVLVPEELQAGMICVLESKGNERDLKVISSKSFLAQLRPLIYADLVVEFKLFAPGFTPQQNHKHLQEAHRDIARLQALCNVYPDCRGVLLVDTQHYFNEERHRELVRLRGVDD